jgi:hypothetical protein
MKNVVLICLEQNSSCAILCQSGQAAIIARFIQSAQKTPILQDVKDKKSTATGILSRYCGKILGR